MKTLPKIFFLILIVLIGFFFINAIQEAPTDTIVERKIVNGYKIYALPIPDKMDFAGERVPLENPDIRERMDRELLVNTYWQSNGLLLFKRAHKFFPILEPLLKKHGIQTTLNT